ncbi:MAG TPA: septum formation family protein [Acidimicrobiales bacterium]|jgi:hypothetical protein
MIRRLLLLAALVAATTLACSKSVATADVGECFERPDDLGSIEDFDTVDCDEAHFGEVYETFDIEGDDYPGDEAVSSEAEERCLSAFEGYVGIPYAESIYGYFSIKPSEESWNEADDHEVLCVLTSLDESELTGSKKGSNE